MRWWLLGGAATFAIAELCDALGRQFIEASSSFAQVPRFLGWLFGLGGLVLILVLRSRWLSKRVSLEEGEIFVEAAYRSAKRFGEAFYFGRDEGTLCEVDGWLHFRGRHGEWSLSRRDAIVRGGQVLYPTPYGQIAVSFVVTCPALGFASGVLGRWDSAPAPEGESTYPVLRERQPWIDPLDGGVVTIAAAMLTLSFWAAPKVPPEALAPFIVIGAAAVLLLSGLALTVWKRRKRWIAFSRRGLVDNIDFREGVDRVKA